MTIITPDKILDDSLEYAIGLYINIDEDRDGMLEKFSGDKIRLVQFLRNREYESNFAPRNYVENPEVKNTQTTKKPKRAKNIMPNNQQNKLF